MKFLTSIFAILLPLAMHGAGETQIKSESTCLPRTVYVGQPVVYSDWLVFPTGTEIAGVAPVTNPFFGGLKFSEIAPMAAQTIDKREKTRAGLRTFILFPDSVGKYNIGGSAYSVFVRKPVRTYSAVRGEFFSYSDEEISLSNPIVKLHVRRLPGNAPADFKGIVGEYTLVYEIPEGRIEPGKEAQFILRLEGAGYLMPDNLPALQELLPRELHVKTVSVSPETRITPEGVRSIAEFECSFTPEKAGLIQLPPIGFTVFNPNKGKYERIEADTAVITISSEPITTSVSSIYVMATPPFEEPEGRHRPLECFLN